MSWTPEKVKQLKKLWQKGKSTVEIGKELGMSKNAVVGKVHRLGLDSRPSPIKKVNEAPAKKTNKVQLPEKTHGIMTLLDLKMNSCRWPIGEVKDENFHFCGKECQTGKPYCPEHCKIAYTSLKELTLQNAKNKKEREALIALPKAEDESAVATKEEKKAESGQKKTTAGNKKAITKKEK